MVGWPRGEKGTAGTRVMLAGREVKEGNRKFLCFHRGLDKK